MNLKEFDLLSFENYPQKKENYFKKFGDKIAIKVGTEFVLANKHDIENIDIVNTGNYIRINGNILNLFKGKTYEESLKIDFMIDQLGFDSYKISDYIVYKND